VVTTLVRGQAGTNGMGIPFYPTGLTVDHRGVLYVTGDGDTVAKVTPNGRMTTLAGLAGEPGSADGAGGDARFRGPAGIAVDQAGILYVADSGNGTIRKITPAGVVSTLAGRAGVRGSADGTGDAARFSGPNDVAVNGDGTLLYVVDSWNNTIRQVTSEGVVTTLASGFNWPAGVAVDNAGAVYVVDSYNQLIRRITPDGSVTTLAGTMGDFGSVDGNGSAARFFLPRGIAVDDAGNLYVADNGNNTIRKGVPSLPDQPMTRQTAANPQAFTLGTTPQTASSWSWQLVRRPAGSTAELSSTTSSNPEFTPDVSDLYVVELRVGNAVGNLSICTLMLNASTTPRLTVVGFARNSFSLSMPSSSGTTCVLEYKDSLSAPNWSALPETASSGGVLTLTDSAATNAQRFYRIRLTSR